MAPADEPFPIPPPPAPVDLLRWVAAAAPHPWFPSRQAATGGVARAALDEPLWTLRQAGLVQVTDFVTGAGQGFRLTAEGERAVRESAREPSAPPSPPVAAAPTAEAVRGERVRRALSDPPAAVVTPLLIVVNVVWYVVGGVVAATGVRGLSDYLKGSSDPVVALILTRLGAVAPSSLLGGEWWRLLTCGFVHVGLFHLLGNMVALGVLGPVAEALWGRARFAAVLLLSGVAGSVAAMAVHPQAVVGGDARDVLLGGSSAGLWGLLFGVAGWLYLHRRHLPGGPRRDWARRLAVVLVMNVLVSFAPGVSLEAHAGGAAAGLLLAAGLGRVGRGERWGGLAGLLAAAGVPAAFAALLAGMMAWGGDWQEVKARAEARRAKQQQAAKEAAETTPPRGDAGR